MKVLTLKVHVEEEVCFSNPFTAPVAVKPELSPYFQPRMSMRFQEEVDWSSGSPRGPTIIMDMSALEAAFE